MIAASVAQSELLREQISLLQAILNKETPAPVITKNVTPDKKKRKSAPRKPITVKPDTRKPKIVDQVVTFLQENREYLSMSGRELEKILVNDKVVSYKTWNEAKRKINDKS